MQFIPLENEEQLNRISAESDHQVILKHNATCSISKGVLDRLLAESETIAGVETIYVLDLLAHRDQVARRKPRRPGYHKQAPRHHRVGMSRSQVTGFRHQENDPGRDAFA